MHIKISLNESNQFFSRNKIQLICFIWIYKGYKILTCDIGSGKSVTIRTHTPSGLVISRPDAVWSHEIWKNSENPLFF